MNGPIRRLSRESLGIDVDRSERGTERDPLFTREWLITNGLGGYASGTISGATTRRHHGLLIAALPAPFGRIRMLGHISELVRLADGRTILFSSLERLGAGIEMRGIEHLTEFRLEMGLPVWRFEVDGTVIEKRLWMPHRQNTVHISYRLVSGGGILRLKLRPGVHFAPHEAPVGDLTEGPYHLSAIDDRFEISNQTDLPPLRLVVLGESSAFTFERAMLENILFRTEQARGYEAVGSLWCPGYFRVNLTAERDATLIASTESWDELTVLSSSEALDAEIERRNHLLDRARIAERDGPEAELVLAADQFIITPKDRSQEKARARAAGDELRTIIAGYHWFTDWGRDTMISLEGLTLKTGRHGEAGEILRTFAHRIRDGLIPNLLPEGGREGLYHTADATLWFFHALHRYVGYTEDRETLSLLLPALQEVIERHVEGTHFGIRVDADDGLLQQGQEGYQLTWMDAKVGDWVVTPRRGKAVEINALWYNALVLASEWTEGAGDRERAQGLRDLAQRARSSFNDRFWFETGGYLYDVVDGEAGDDPACRPNQIFAISLDRPVLETSRWKDVLRVVQEKLFTPVGLRSLSPDHPEYKRTYFGDLRSRDAAYHQGTIWAWLVGPFVDAWTKTYPLDEKMVHSWQESLMEHLDEACVGSISEIFDADPPFHPRGCIAQAWSVAEALRVYPSVSMDQRARSSGGTA